MNNALELFTAVPKQHNCAQAVVCGFGHAEFNAAMASCGGGKAPDGICGALHGALLLLPPDKHEAAKARFLAAAGALKCRELKSANVNCQSCVACAAKIVEEYL